MPVCNPVTLKYKVSSPDPDENPIVAALDKVLWQNYHGDGDFDEWFYLWVYKFEKNHEA